MINLIIIFMIGFKKGFIKIFKKNPKKYMQIDSNLNIKDNEKIILNKVNDLI